MITVRKKVILKIGEVDYILDQVEECIKALIVTRI